MCDRGLWSSPSYGDLRSVYHQLPLHPESLDDIIVNRDSKEMHNKDSIPGSSRPPDCHFWSSQRFLVQQVPNCQTMQQWCNHCDGCFARTHTLNSSGLLQQIKTSISLKQCFWKVQYSTSTTPDCPHSSPQMPQIAGWVLSWCSCTLHIVPFASRTLSTAERNTTVKKEALVSVWAVEKWRTYMWGHRFTLRTDHQLGHRDSQDLTSIDCTAAHRFQSWVWGLFWAYTATSSHSFRPKVRKTLPDEIHTVLPGTPWACCWVTTGLSWDPPGGSQVSSRENNTPSSRWTPLPGVHSESCTGGHAWMI